MTNILAFNKPPIIKSAVTDVGNLAVERDFRATAPKEIADIFFPVEMVPLESLTGIKDCGFQAVVRKDTNKILKVHGSRYTLIKNEDVFGSVDKILRKTEGLDTDGMRVVDQTAYAGGRTIRSYVFPAHEIKINDGDVTQLRVNVINSYDGSTNLRICMGGYRIVCANGMIIGDSIGNYTNRHSSGFSSPEITNRMASTLNNFFQVGEQWKHGANTPCSNLQAQAVINKLAGESDSLRSDLADFWLDEKHKLGGSMWALFNALTFWSTHYEIKGASQDNASAIVQSREARVARIVSSDLFKAAA